MGVSVQFRRGTAAQWTSSDPVLLAGELGYETDTKRWKIGDGTTAWGSLDYVEGTGADVFTALTDVPASYTDQAGKTLVVKVTEDGLEFSDAGAGDMTKAVYDQDDDGIVDAAEEVNDGVNSASAADLEAAVTKLAGIEAAADVTGSHAPQAHKDSHDPQDGDDPLDCAAAGEIVGVAAAAEGAAHSFARSDHTHQIQHGIADNHVVTIDGDPNSGEYARFTASGLEGLTAAELLAAIFATVLPENVGIQFDDVLSADGAYSGFTLNGIAGAALAFGQAVYQAVGDDRWELAKGDAVATTSPFMGICVLAANGDGDPTKILYFGKVRADAQFPTFTKYAPVFLSTATAGAVTTTLPTKSTGHCLRILGRAITADAMFVNPEQGWDEYA
jgi:hypothetical protein